VGNAGVTLCGGTPGRPGEPDVARPGLFAIAAMYPVAGQALLAPAISGAALDSAPTYDGVAGPDSKKLSYYHRVDALRPEVTVHEGHPRFVAGFASRRFRQRWGSVHSGDEGTAGFRRGGLLLTQVRSMGPVDGDA